MEEPIFICNSDSHHLVASFIGALENLASQKKAKWKAFFLISRQQKGLNWIASWRNLRNVIIDDRARGLTWVKMTVITKFVSQLNSCRFKKNQSIHRQEFLDHFCKALLVFGFNSANYHLNLIKSYLLPIFVNERDNEPTVIKRTNQLIPLKFGVFQLLDIKNFLGGATNLDSFLTAYRTSETKGFCP